MINEPIMKRLLPLALLPVFLITACSSVNQKEQLMSAAGFRTVIPNTPAQIAHLKSLPQDKIIPITKKGKTLFIFADARNNWLLIGNQQQYQLFRQYALQYKIQEDKVEAASMNADAAEWGGWGGIGGPFWGPCFY